MPEGINGQQCPRTDVWAQRIAICFLGCIALAAVLIIGRLAHDRTDIPPALAGIGGTALGALTMMLPGVLARR